MGREGMGWACLLYVLFVMLCYVINCCYYSPSLPPSLCVSKRLEMVYQWGGMSFRLDVRLDCGFGLLDG